MVFPVVGGNQSSGDLITNSLRFNSADSPELTKTFGSAGGDTWSYSCWLKRGDISEQGHGLLKANTNAGLYFLSTGALVINDDGASAHTSTELFRDVGAWYHILFTGNGTTNKVYVNNSQLTFSGGTPNIGDINNNVAHSISKSAVGVEYMDGYLAEIHFVDGTEKAPTDFAETNDNGVWVPKKYTGSYGTNGFYLQFQQTGTSANASGIGADTSGNDNHFAVSNLVAIDVTIDTPQNNFCTLNPLHKSTSDVVLSEGNLKMVSGYASGWQHAAGTMAVQNGKWYWEAKATTVSASDKTSIGVLQFNTSDVDFINNTNTDRSSKGISGHGAGTGSYSYSQGDIIMCAMDIDNNKIYWGKNGTFFGTLDPANGTGSTTQTIDNANFCVPAVGGYGGSTWEMNFGVPQFAISSGNTDGLYGNFEYAPPSGYYALCTKRLAEYG
jgi:hypothetical protein